MPPFVHRNVRENGRPCFSWFGPIPNVTITDPGQVRDMLSNKLGHFEKPQVTKLLADGLTSHDGEKWHQEKIEEKKDQHTPHMATSKKEVRHGTAHAKVNGDDEMLRTGFINGTPLEAGKIADSQPVDLFAQARRISDASSQQQRPEEEEEGRKIAESEPVDLFSDAGRVAQANNNQQQQQQKVGRQGMAEPTAGGRQA
ncbi:hypothetical protein E2562_020781 [Oryza meyeriana var. granulata]|uniref:Uncharacterized protein n=1 Tax=Oryza meyeriana var. granulata TaxID=110450 RepID=A0A6G1CHE4_9ORYZ|nr:hypothetical protein E2562_020781 [Oryza meyeriana var. granulata]